MRVLWSSEMLCLLREKYSDTPNIEIARLLNVSVGKVASKAHCLGLKKSDAFMKSPLSGRLNGNQGVCTRFCKNMPGWNKGLK